MTILSTSDMVSLNNIRGAYIAGMIQGTLNRARMLEQHIQHLTYMSETCWNIVSNNTYMDICFSNNAANTNTQHSSRALG